MIAEAPGAFDRSGFLPGEAPVSAIETIRMGSRSGAIAAIAAIAASAASGAAPLGC